MRNTVGKSWLHKLLLMAGMLMLLQGCAGRSMNCAPVAPPRIPSPQAELMQPPALTSSQLLESAQGDMIRWSDMLRDSPTK